MLRLWSVRLEPWPKAPTADSIGAPPSSSESSAPLARRRPTFQDFPLRVSVLGAASDDRPIGGLYSQVPQLSSLEIGPMEKKRGDSYGFGSSGPDLDETLK